MIPSRKNNKNCNQVFILKISIINQNLINFCYNRLLKFLVKLQWNQQVLLIYIEITRINKLIVYKVKNFLYNKQYKELLIFQCLNKLITHMIT